MAKRTIDHSGRDVPRKLDVQDEPPEPRPRWFVVTVKDSFSAWLSGSEGVQVGYAYAHSGERFELSDDGQLIRVAMTPVDKSTEGQVEQ